MKLCSFDNHYTTVHHVWFAVKFNSKILQKKYQIREQVQTEQLLTSARFFQDDVYAQFCDLSTAKKY